MCQCTDFAGTLVDYCTSNPMDMTKKEDAGAAAVVDDLGVAVSSAAGVELLNMQHTRGKADTNVLDKRDNPLHKSRSDV